MNGLNRLVFGAVVALVCIPASAQDDEVARLKEDNARLRQIANSAMESLQARSYELEMSKKLIEALKKTNERQEELIDSLQSLANVNKLMMDLLMPGLTAYQQFAEACAKINEKDKSALLASKDPAAAKMRWRLKASLDARLEKQKALEAALQPIVPKALGTPTKESGLRTREHWLSPRQGIER